MAVLGFSHITCEVINFDQAIDFWKAQGFVEQFKLSMPILPCKNPILSGHPTQVRLSYLTYQSDELCNIELITHDEASVQGRQEERLVPVFYSRHVKKEAVIIDPEGNEIRLFPKEQGPSERHYMLPASDVAATVDFYKKHFGLIDIPGSRGLRLGRYLHPNWSGTLHIVPSRYQTPQRKLNEPGFQSFCFLVNDAEKDIYAHFNREHIFGPIEEIKKVKGKDVAFEVGFFYDPAGFPVEYLQITPRKG